MARERVVTTKVPRKRKIVRTNAHKALGKKKNRHNPGPSYK